MGKLEFNTSLLDHYISIFSRMSKDARQYLIERLQKIDNEPEHENKHIDLFGSWKSDESADELIETIYSSRSNTRIIEEL